MTLQTISGYDRQLGRCIEPEGSQSAEDRPYRGTSLDSDHFIVNLDDLPGSERIFVPRGRSEEESGIILPDQIYRIVTYNERTLCAQVEAIQDERTIRRVMLRFSGMES